MAHAVPTNDACGFAGCLTSSNTILFTELVYTGSVNSSTDLPVNNFVLPQLTDYFPSGNPLRSCTTASLVSYTPNAQPALVKRDAQPVAINTFPGVPTLTPVVTYTAEANSVDPPPSTVSPDNDGGEAPATEDGSASNSPPATSSPESPPSQQDTQTASDTPAPPSSATQEASTTQAASQSATATDGSTLAGNTALGTTTLSASLTQIAGNVSSSQPSTWNYICSAEGCTLASSSGATASSANASSSSTESVSQTTAQSASERMIPVYGIGSMLLMVALAVVG